MRRYICKRLGVYAAIFVGVTILIFGMMMAMPGDPFSGLMLDPSIPPEYIEQQQEKLLIREQKRTCILKSIMYTVVIYLIFLAVCFVEHSLIFTLESELVWGLLGNRVIWAEFFIATAIVVMVWARNFRNKE